MKMIVQVEVITYLVRSITKVIQTMNTKQRKQMYPANSYNSMSRCEQRWEDDANVYGDISSEWQISLGNGKRLSRKWRRCGGLAIVQDPWSGADRSIYNESYDIDWQQAKSNNQY